MHKTIKTSKTAQSARHHVWCTN